MTDRLAPQANVFAFFDTDPRTVEAVTRALRSGGEFDEAWFPAEGWVVAEAPLPHGGEPSAAGREAGLTFAEGAGVVGSYAPLAQLCDGAPERLARIPGDFSFIRCRPRGGATVVRSAAGLVPWYVRATPTRVVAATLLGDIARYDPTEPVLDEFTLAAWTSGFAVFPDHRSFLVGVEVVPPGHAWVAGPAARLVRYWDPRPPALPPPNAGAHRERAAQLRTLLVDALERDLDAGTGNLLTFSGGVDSSALGALAVGVAGRPLASLSLVPPEDHPLRARELSYIEPLAAQYGFDPLWLHPMSRGRQAGEIGAAPRGLMPVLHPALNFVNNHLSSAGLRVLVGGEYADEVCGSAYTYPDWAMHVTPRTIRPLPTGPRDLARIVKWRALWAAGRPALRYPGELSPLVRADLRDEWREWRRRHLREVAADRGVWPYRWAWWRHDGWLAMNWEALTPLGIRRSFPFVRRAVLELAYRCHPVEIAGPGTKRLLRDAVAGDVPARNLERTDKGRWSHTIPGSSAEFAVDPVGDRLPVLVPDAGTGDLVATDRRVVRVVAATAASLSARRRLHQPVD